MRNRIPLVILAALLILALPATLPAQPAAEPGHDCANCSNPGPETPGRMSRKTGFGLRGLELTEAQRGEFAELRAEQVKATASVRDELKLKKAELAELWLAGSPDENKIIATVRQVSEVRAKLAVAQVNHRLAALKLLTAEQRAQLRNMAREGGRRGRGMREGGMHGKGMRGQGRHGNCQGDCGNCTGHKPPGE